MLEFLYIERWLLDQLLVQLKKKKKKTLKFSVSAALITGGA